jgi:hypothetical protein
MGHERAIARRAIKFDLGLLQEIERAGKRDAHDPGVIWPGLCGSHGSQCLTKSRQAEARIHKEGYVIRGAR